jgi:hypothetical protein
VITDVFAESSVLLGSDVALLIMPDRDAMKIGLTPPIGFGAAYGVVDRSGDRKMARDFTRAVLTLRRDERVQGRELR